MPSEPTPAPKGDRPAVARPFVDREEFIAPVDAALKEPQRTKPLVLVYFGGAGIGKSRLRRELTKQMAAEPGVLTATLDFAIPVYRQPDAALFFLRKAIREAYQATFPSFDLAYAVYWQKAHPETALGDDVKPLLESGSLLPQLVDDSGKLPLIGLIPKVSALVGSRQHVVDRVGPASDLLSTTYYSDWWERRGERELEDLPQMEPGEIVERLPKLWASDLKDFLQRESRESGIGSGPAGTDSPLSTSHSRSAVLFFDTYEQLWGTGDGGQEAVDSRQKTDEWVRELVKQLPEALWIICGRQKLRWEEVDPDWSKALSQHQLGALPDPAARRFLESCDITDGQIQDGIVKGSQGVPHYLDLAVDTVQSARRKVRDAKFRGGSPEELVAEFTQQLDKPEVETLQVLSAPRFWYYGLFENLMTKYQTGYPLTGYEDLSRFSFVTDGAAPGTRTMHELMREALQEHQAPELRKRVHLFLHELYAKQLEGLGVKNITEKHKAALTEAFYHGRQAKSAEELWSWLEAAGTVFHDAGQYRLLIPLHREMVQALETELGPNHPDAATVLYKLADELTNLDEYDEAEPLFRRALAIFERELGPEHETVCSCLVWLARTLRERARFDEAEVLCRRAVGVSDKPGSAVLLRWEAVSNLAVLLVKEHKYTEAEEFSRRALAISEKELGPEHRYTANDLNTLAGLFLYQGRYAEAVPLLRRALAIYEKILGANHVIITYPMDLLGVALRFLGRYSEAEPLHRRALRLREETLGPDRPHTAITMNQLGTLLREQGRYAEAERLLRRALVVFEKTVGLDHPNPTVTAGNLIGVLVRRGEYADAEPMVLSAIATREKRLGPDRPETATVVHWAGVMRIGQERYSEAEAYLRRALDIRTKVLGPEHPETLQSLDAQASLEERQGRHSEAESLYRDVLEKRERVQGSDHPDVANTANLLAGICGRDGRHAEAEALYRRALAIREKAFGPGHPFTAETLEGLAKVCEQTGRAAEAQELAERARRIRAQAEPAPTNPQQQA